MFTIESMIKKAQKNGHGSEETMWVSVRALEKIKEEHKELYWKIARDMHCIIYNGHYSEEFADYDVSKIYFIDKNGQKIYGPYWTATQIEEATKSLSFPPGTTKWDKYVAYNVMYTDLQGDFNDEEILRAAYKFFFKDPDFLEEKTTKIWHYMNC